MHNLDSNGPPAALTDYVDPQPFSQAPAGRFEQPEVRLGALAAALGGVPLGDYDLRILRWVVGWDDATARTLVSLFWRCRMAGWDDRVMGGGGWMSGGCT